MGNPQIDLHLCAGYDGIGRGLELAGVGKPDGTIYVEIESYAVFNLVKAIEAGRVASGVIHSDIKGFPYQELAGHVRVLTAGFPCQPFSSAGSRRGVEDPRHLWPHIARGISLCRPRYVFCENVEGIISSKTAEGESVLLYVLRELESLGYRATAGIFSASEVGAPHQRKRVFILANANSESGREQAKGWQHDAQVGSAGEELAHANGQGLEGDWESTHQHGEKGWFNKEQHTTQKGLSRELASRWPAVPGEDQKEWEEPRQIGVTLNCDWVEQLMGLPVGWTGDGSRTDRLRLLGNGVVPQVAAKAWLTLMDRL